MTSLGELDPLAFEPRISYYMLQEDKQKALNKKALLHRLIYISKISADVENKILIGKYYEDLFDKLQRKHHSESASGILLVYPDHVVHVLETSIDVISDVIRRMRTNSTEPLATTMLGATKILTINHDIQSRLFQQWNCRILNLARSIGTAESVVPVEEVVVESISLLLNLGMFLLKSPKSNSPERFQELAGPLLIHHDHISVIMRSDVVLSPDQYLEIFDRPLDVVLDGETMWPLDLDIQSSITQ